MSNIFDLTLLRILESLIRVLAQVPMSVYEGHYSCGLCHCIVLCSRYLDKVQCLVALAVGVFEVRTKSSV